ncbi:uncharacterized protein NECHADRAFT_86575 [Fusarium vanettenii 77-13-4]|uniref:Protein kinase domain-containing protein n=1 Tax=Fusarium vanettenii (strain ATCC MYA-4622 / CBS 123669 / FGSC 9596 / NRRL 45880 / 77-13-4) TaxID=660122 RepID=C7ZH26_FUSV7|nr:uncharacterized protein NECHADRAFT_86575 [Fusarium vanettenii 77-13-4]EEU36739.1 predicted protein [Fusarium vanettenii 77-13-4]
MLVGFDLSCHPLEGQRRRPATDQRTGRRKGLFAANAGESSKSSALVKNASTRHTRIRQETGGNHVATLNRLINTLQESGIPGPQLFRLKNEFSHQLGQGGQGNVRGLDDGVARLYQRADKRIRKIWPVKQIAIKQYIRMRGGRADTRFCNDNLSSRFRAAECEVLALSPGLFRDHPNIVKLVGWGLCLDTIEDPASPCCGGLQLPLLVFERAEMDLAEFLERLFPEPQRSDDARAEEGLAGPFLARKAEPQPSWWSWRLQMCWTSLQRWSGLEPDPYELVRLLCIDIGHGLQSLHENHFTHGDLKPENVLIFNNGGTWTAKLCDFGCAVGQDKTTNQQDDATIPNVQKEEYLGTPYWLPSGYELAALGGFESLQKCDLYVYGLLVWSSFCLRGKHPQARPELDDALSDLKELSDRLTHMLLPLSPYKQRLLDQVSALLENTMVDPADRSLKPWTYLYLDYGQDTQSAESDDSDCTPAIDITPPDYHAVDTRQLWPHLTLEMKAGYKECPWWCKECPWWCKECPLWCDDRADHCRSDPFRHIATTLGDLPDDGGRGPASRVALSSDDNCLSTTLFSTERRHKNTIYLPSYMSRLLREGQRSNWQGYTCRGLYYLARFRSRVKLEWWEFCTDACAKNFVRAALRAYPPVDTDTLAWLCTGPIGSAEVRALDGDFSTWESILLPGRLDESMRLDRFLLLLQFGAHVEREASTQAGQLRDIHIEASRHSGTVFSRYLRSCRPATIPTVMKEIIHRLGRAYKEGAKRDLAKDHNHPAMQALARCMAQKRDLFNSESSMAATEREPMLPRYQDGSATLPSGWKRHAGTGLEFFEDMFTQSVTLIRPEISPLDIRQVKVGFLQNHNSCHVDLLSCMRVGSSQNKRRQFEQDLENRFPYYDSNWFSSEWEKEPDTKDVLKEIGEPWRIRTFTTFLRTPGVMDKILAFLRMAGKVLAGGIFALALVAILAAIAFAMWITFGWVAVGMIVWCVSMLILVYIESPKMQ